MEYEVVIGIEVHAQLLTHTKMFCGCSSDYALASPNTHVCPVCLGMPGTLPVINRQAVEHTIMTAMALNCAIADASKFDRKNYPYPDLPKGYQISQYDMPLSRDGWLEVEADGQVGKIGIERVHLEEDTAKLTHESGHSLVDFNRAGVPLMEIVSRPDLRSPEEARQYLSKLRVLLRYLGVSTGNMEEGAMRCEPNVSLRPVGSETQGTKVEIKNLNSFRSVKQALEYEIERQSRLLKAGAKVEQVTMGWDEACGHTVFQRSKEFAHDYRYFPEPDLPPLMMGPAWLRDIRNRLPELPDEKLERFVEEYGLTRYDAALLATDRGIAEYYEAAVSYTCKATDGGEMEVGPKTICNWIVGELFRLMRDKSMELQDVVVAPNQLVDLILLLVQGSINATVAKAVFEEMFASGREAHEIVAERGLAQISDLSQLEQVIEVVLGENPRPVAQYLGGKEAALQFLMGQVMKATGGRANPEIVLPLLKEWLELRRRRGYIAK